METKKTEKTPERIQAAILRRLTEIRNAALLGAKDTLTMEECHLLTGYAVSTLRDKVQRKEIPHFRPTPKKIYFSKQAVERWMRETPVASAGEINSKAETYTALRKCKAARGKD